MAETETESVAVQLAALHVVGPGIAPCFFMLEKFTAYQFAKQFYWGCKSLKVPRILHDQLIRASSSVALNLSEASGRRTAADQRKHYAIAFGSLQECRTILDLEKIENKELLVLADQLAAMLYTMSRKKLETEV